MYNTLMNMNENPDVPDLIPADLLFDDLLDINSTMVPAIPNELNELSRKVEQLTIEYNTMHLRLEIERAKRQRLQSIVKQLKREALSPCPVASTVKQELKEFKEQQTATNYMLDGENAKTNTLAFRSISRICQLINIIVQGTYITTDIIDEANTLLQELTLTIQQFGVHYTSSYV